MRKNNMELWTNEWYFLKTPLDTTWEEMQGRREEFLPVEVPHDWLIYDSKNLYEDSFGWYRKTFQAELSEGERLIVRFDGVYMDSTVYLNGEKVMDWKYGYTTFDADLTDHLKKGENELVLLVRHQSPNSRWYSGAGIYRNVWLKRCGKAYLPLDGTYVNIRPLSRPEEKNSVFSLDMETELEGEDLAESRVEYLLREDFGERKTGGIFGKWQADVDAGAKKAGASVRIEDPALWDVEDPRCYVLEVKLYQKDALLDCQEITVGFRSVAFDPQKGLFLNGRQVKVHGVCEHHDLGCLGSAFHEEALRRQFRILREMGVNGLRTSHNPPAPEFLELADRMGFLVVDEAFDMWERSKTTYDYARFFVQWAERDVASWIRRDRNHPSLLLWSIGNEIYDTHADEHGQEITRRLVGYVRDNDPKENARVTIGSNYMPWENARKCADIVKIAGYNYGERYYDEHHAQHPDWIIYGSETASVVQSRGIYHFPLSQSILSDEDEQCSALGNSSTSWGADSTEQCIIDDRDASFAFGQFVWTGFDYIGEPTPYHTKNSYFGQIDTAGFPKDPYYTFQSVWTDYREKPMIHVFPYWDFNPGQIIDVRVATNAPQAELFVNGRRQGRQTIDHKNGRSLLASWQVPYEPGVIMAVAYDQEGREVARQERRSFGSSHQICLTPDKTELKADARDLCFVTVETLDAQGHPVENAVDYVKVKLEGPARLLGLDNGDSTDYDDYKSDTRKLFSGKLLAVIGTTDQAGEIKVTVSGEGLCPAQLLLEAHEAEALEKHYLENCVADEKTKEHRETISAGNKPGEHERRWIPTRKIELTLEEEPVFTPERRELTVTAKVLPEDAAPELIWKVVNDAGIDVPMAKAEPLNAEGNIHKAKVTAKGDGSFRVRCMAKEPIGKVTVISQLELRAEGLGTSFLNPYELVTAGLFTESFGEIGNGNEKGISTARDGESGVVFDGVDFGDYGSDEITIPVFALSGEEYLIELWTGMPRAEGSVLIDTLHYQKPSIWNVYQEETWKLPRRLKGVTSLGLLMRDQKVHIKGFSFKKLEKAFGELYAGEASRVYGDDFKINGSRVEGIGNNVTLEFENMDFGETGSSQVEICGWTPLPVNTIHIRFNPENGGEMQARMAEFRGGDTNEYNRQTFSFEKICGRGRLDLVFLPGCQFNLESIRFRKDEG